MPHIQNSVIINAPVEKVWSTAKKYEEFPTFMKDIVSLKIVEEDGDRMVSEWIGKVPTFGLKITWTQEDIWDEEKKQSTFKQLKGDYDMMEGTWTFTEENGVTTFTSSLDYEYNIPGLGAIVKKVIEKIARDNIQGILDGLKSRCEEESICR